MSIADLPEDTTLVYANWMRMNATLFDLGIDFGYHEDVGPPESYPVRVVMSWEHAQQLIDLLQNNLENYESQIRRIERFDDDEEESSPGGD